MTHFRVSEGSYLAPSSPLLPAQPLVRSRPDLHGPVCHACALFPIPFFVGNPRSFSFNSPRNRKKSRGSQVLGIVSFLLTSVSFRNDVGVLFIAIPSLVHIISQAELDLPPFPIVSSNEPPVCPSLCHVNIRWLPLYPMMTNFSVRNGRFVCN